MKELKAEQIKALQRETFKKTKRPLKTVDGEMVRSRIPEEKNPAPKPVQEPVPVAPRPIDYSENLNGIAVMVTGAIQENTKNVTVTNKAIGGISEAIARIVEAMPKPITGWKITVSERDLGGKIKSVDLSAK